MITPGVFERWQRITTKPKNGDRSSNQTEQEAEKVAFCRAWPWEWQLAHTANSNQTPGSLVSVATDKPVPISCRNRYAGDSGEGDRKLSIPSPQVFAAPPGSLYYLNSPPCLYKDDQGESKTALFQDSPEAPAAIRRWRQLGYSELFWLPFEEN